LQNAIRENDDWRSCYFFAVRILIVDDHDDTARILSEWLEALGHETAIAHDAPTALLGCKTLEPDVAFLDIQLPVIDGYELGKRLRAHGVKHLVAITGTAPPERSHAEGYVAHLTKPVSLVEVERLLRSISLAE
jgi:CheY-like chemotaxis protein